MSADLSLSSPRLAKAHSSRHRLALALMTASGFAGLGYQIVWTQQSAAWLGHEAAAVLAVVTAFFGGLALGALWLGPRIDRSHRPARWYAACELTIALWSVVLALVLEPINQWLLGLTGVQPTPVWQWTMAFGGTFVVLLPATTAMGATLPAMERVTAQMHDQRGGIAALYAFNTLGAFAGVLATAFWLVPELGLARTAAVCATLNVFCALAVLRFSPANVREASASDPGAPTRRGALAVLAITGLLGIGYEVLVVRVLSQVAEDTVYTFALLLAVYLVGTALGASVYQRRLGCASDTDRLRDRLLALQAAACLLGTASLWCAELVSHAVRQGLGGGMAAALTAEAVLALLAFLPPTVVMGALFSHLATQARAANHSFGRALGFNTFGAALGPLLFGVVLVPLVGPKAALLLVAAGYLALVTSRSRALPLVLGTAATVAALAWMAPPLAFVDVPAGGRVVSYQEGAVAAVSVVEDIEGVARLRINNRQQEGSSATLLADARQALLPLLLHPAPRHALFLGLGTGVTASAAAQDPTLQVDAVELLPEVIAASAHFTKVFASDVSKMPGAMNPRLHIMAGDARRFVRTSGQRYDLIVADNFHPARSGSAALYTVEHFRAVQSRLADGGIFCQWLPLHQLDLDTVRSIVASFMAANPDAWALLATNSLETPVLGLVARRGEGRLKPRQLRERLVQSSLPQSLADFGIADEFALLGGFVAGPRALARFAGDAPRNTDDRPVVAYRAPRITYAPDSQPAERLISLLRELAIDPAELVDAGTERDWVQRLAAYWRARDHFIEAGQQVRPSADVRHMLGQVREPLLSALSISPDFRPAYDPLLRMAAALSRTDVEGARSLFMALQQVQPARPEAALALRKLAATSP